MAKKQRIHVRETHLYTIKHHWQDGSFELIIETEKKEVVLHLDRFDVVWIAEKLWEIVNAEQKQVDELKAGLANEPHP